MFFCTCSTEQFFCDGFSSVEMVESPLMLGLFFHCVRIGSVMQEVHLTLRGSRGYQFQNKYPNIFTNYWNVRTCKNAFHWNCYYSIVKLNGGVQHIYHVLDRNSVSLFPWICLSTCTLDQRVLNILPFSYHLKFEQSIDTIQFISKLW